MENTFTREQITAALAQEYRTAYDRYELLEHLSTEALQDDDMNAFDALSRRAAYRGQFLFGIKKSAEALGIGEAEFMAAVNSDKEVHHAKNET